MTRWAHECAELVPGMKETLLFLKASAGEDTCVKGVPACTGYAAETYRYSSDGIFRASIRSTETQPPGQRPDPEGIDSTAVSWAYIDRSNARSGSRGNGFYGADNLACNTGAGRLARRRSEGP